MLGFFNFENLKESRKLNSRIFFASLFCLFDRTFLTDFAVQYYYAHAPKNFSTEGAQHFKEDGKIYGGDPVLIKTYSTDEKA